MIYQNRNDMITANFEFIEVKDFGETSCPHCGAEGRYIYFWLQDGVKMSAMAGCYKALTGKLAKNDEAKYMELLSVKLAKNKDLNGWDRNIIRLLDYKKESKFPEDWCNQKIKEILSQRKSLLARKGYSY